MPAPIDQDTGKLKQPEHEKQKCPDANRKNIQKPLIGSPGHFTRREQKHQGTGQHHCAKQDLRKSGIQMPEPPPGLTKPDHGFQHFCDTPKRSVVTRYSETSRSCFTSRDASFGTGGFVHPAQLLGAVVWQAAKLNAKLDIIKPANIGFNLIAGLPGLHGAFELLLKYAVPALRIGPSPQAADQRQHGDQNKNALPCPCVAQEQPDGAHSPNSRWRLKRSLMIR